MPMVILAFGNITGGFELAPFVCLRFGGFYLQCYSVDISKMRPFRVCICRQERVKA